MDIPAGRDAGMTKLFFRYRGRGHLASPDHGFIVGAVHLRKRQVEFAGLRRDFFPVAFFAGQHEPVKRSERGLAAFLGAEESVFGRGIEGESVDDYFKRFREA